MAIPAVLAALPWGTIIEAAPVVFDRATQLVRSMKSTPRKEAVALATDGAVPDGMAALRLAVQQLEAAVATLNSELVQATDLVAELAKANAAVTEKLTVAMAAIQHQRLWLAALSATSAIALAVAVYALGAV